MRASSGGPAGRTMSRLKEPSHATPSQRSAHRERAGQREAPQPLGAAALPACPLARGGRFFTGAASSPRLEPRMPRRRTCACRGGGGARVRMRDVQAVGLLLLAAACRGAAPGSGTTAEGDAAVTARTWGLAYLQGNQLPQAEAEFRKVIEHAPDQAVGYADLGLVYLRSGRYREAETQLRRAAALDSTDSDIGLMLASVYELTGREADARREIERALARD